MPLPGQGGPSWLPDPAGRFEMRYWDGQAWTTAVQTGGQTLSDAGPLPEGQPGAAIALPEPPPPIDTGPSHVPAPSPGDRHTSLSPNEAQRQLGQMLVAEGWNVVWPVMDRFELSLKVPGNANPLLGCLLLLIWVLPGIIYFLLAGRSTVHRATLIFVREGSGTRIAVQASPQATQRLGGVMARLPW
jgi:hypothetical protein